MTELDGWILDVYPDPNDGAVVWFIGEDGSRRRLWQDFPICFFAAGPPERLRLLWKLLARHPIPVELQRVTRTDLFAGTLDVLAARVRNPVLLPRVFTAARRSFPDLDYYDADLPFSLRFAVHYDVFPFTLCRAQITEDNRLAALEPIESRWELDPTPPPLRILTLQPDADPHHAPPSKLKLSCGRETYDIPLQCRKTLVISVRAMLQRFDPDVVITNWGDSWLFPHLAHCAEECGLHFNPNRDKSRPALQRKENSYFVYGHVIHRFQQTHLLGRLHIDRLNAMIGAEHIEGAIEQARVSALPAQETARKSPGASISAMQMIVALRRGVMIPHTKTQAEYFKTAAGLIRSDRGGLVYQPLIGLHTDVAEIDFSSMYPSIMTLFNISPETVQVETPDCAIVPEIGIPVDQSHEGLVPETLRDLLEKRLALKLRLAELAPRDCRRPTLKARDIALKWLLVVCFGYMGYKRARFGRIEGHEAVTAYSRELLLRAKEAAEDFGFTVIHMYIDGLWVKKPGAKKVGDFNALLMEINRRTRLPITLEGIYRWIAFLPSRVDARVPTPNRYFGVFYGGDLKIRGIDLRRRDTPTFIGETQRTVLERLAAVQENTNLPLVLPAIVAFLHRQLNRLRAGQVPLEELVVSQAISRTLDEYRVPSPAARAGAQMEAVGKSVQPGQRIRFLYTRGQPGVHAWDVSARLHPSQVDTSRYAEMLLRAIHTILQPFGVDEAVLRLWLFANAAYAAPPGVLPTPQSAARWPLFDVPVKMYA